MKLGTVNALKKGTPARTRRAENRLTKNGYLNGLLMRSGFCSRNSFRKAIAEPIVKWIAQSPQMLTWPAVSPPWSLTVRLRAQNAAKKTVQKDRKTIAGALRRL